MIGKITSPKKREMTAPRKGGQCDPGREEGKANIRLWAFIFPKDYGF